MSLLDKDFYQINMIYLLWAEKEEKETSFEVFFRKHPTKANFSIFAGKHAIKDFLGNYQVTQEELDYLAEVSPKFQDAGFQDFLKNTLPKKVKGANYRCMSEGTVMFPQEPIFQASAPLYVALAIETEILSIVNAHSTYATVAANIVASDPKKTFMEFGMRRALGDNSADIASYASYLAGFQFTSNMRAGHKYGIPVVGTHSHALVQYRGDEREVFQTFSKHFPDNDTLLIDTYDTLNKGLKAAIQVGKENGKLKGVRLDSGDLAYLSKECRKELDAAGLTNTKIIASNDLDADLIRSLRAQGAQIDVYGVGTKLVAPQANLGAVMKLVEVEGEPRMKVSSTAAKSTYPFLKDIKRFYMQVGDESFMIGDYIMAVGEELPEHVTIYHPELTDTYKTIDLTRTDIYSEDLLYPLVFNVKSDIEADRERCQANQESLYEEYKRHENPPAYPVGFSDKIWKSRKAAIKKAKGI